MKTDTKQQLLDFIANSEGVSPAELAKALHISPQMVHRHLKALVAEGAIKKLGQPPQVRYIIAPTHFAQAGLPKLSQASTEYIERHYMTVKPNGEVLLGVHGFQWWAQKTKQDKHIGKLAEEYVGNHRELSEKFKGSKGLIDATFKVSDTFAETFVDVLLYQEFYSLPKFGKTKSGQMVFLGKSGQDLKMIRELASQCKESLQGIIKQYKIQALVFAPHSIPRKVSFLKEFEKYLSLPLPKLQLLKVFSGAPVAQKSLQKLSDRIENAQETIFLKEQGHAFKRVLVIDDAVGSGATINAIAQKLKSSGVDFVVGYAVTGSLKEFEIINEI